MLCFHKSEQETPSRKTVRRMLALIPVLVLAVAAYSVSVFAWFQGSLTNKGNIIHAGEFSARVELVGENDTVLWDGDNLREYDGAPAISQSDAVIVTLRIVHQGSLPCQYQVALSAGGAPLTLTADVDTPAYTPGEKQILEIGKTHTYTVALPNNAADLYLRFRVAFRNNPVPTLSTNVAGWQNSLAPQQTPSGGEIAASGPEAITAAPTTATQPRLSSAPSKPETSHSMQATQGTNTTAGTPQTTAAPSRTVPEDNVVATSDGLASTDTDHSTTDAPSSKNKSETETTAPVQPTTVESAKSPCTTDKTQF